MRGHRHAITGADVPSLPRRPRLVRMPLALSLLGGLGLALCFPPFDAPWPLLPISLASWLHGIQGRAFREAALHTLGFGLAFQFVLLRWAIVIGTDAWLALALVEAVFLLPLGLAAARVQRPLALVPLLAIGLPATDWVRDHAGVLAFGWGQLAFASLDAPWVRLAPSAGQWAVTGCAAATGAAIVALIRGRATVRVLAAGTLVLLLTVPLLLPTALPTRWSADTIALVQGGADHLGVGVQDPRAVLRRHAALTVRSLAGTAAHLVVWPENAVDVDPMRDAAAREILLRTSADIGRPLLIGAIVDVATGRTNAMVRVERGTMTTTYVKQRLVPFGEYLPMRDLFTRVFERAALIPVDFVPGPDPGAVSVAGRRMGLLICFEIADEALARAAVEPGASALLLQTNNATYAGTGQGEQQLRIAQFRAIELGVPVYVVSTTGPSAVISANGRIMQTLRDGATGVLLAPLPAHRVPV